MLKPKTSLSQLSRLRARERFYLLVWGLTRWLAVAAVVLGVAVVVDWTVDKYRDTPRGLRLLLTGLQLVIDLAAAWFFILRPMARGAGLVPLARRAEEHIPEFEHRLVTAIQLTRPGARTAGMSAELIDAVTEEAEAISRRHNLARLADNRRLKWAAFVAPVPCLALGWMLAFFGPALLLILIQRQFLINRDIPRDVHLVSVTPGLWPSGDEVTVRYEVSGQVRTDAVGRLRVMPDGQPADEYPLTYEGPAPDGKTFFTAKVPPSTVPFDYRAWLSDGRTRQVARVEFEPRPVVNRVDAWVQLPVYVGKRPDGLPYETAQQQGEVVGLDGSTARLRIEAQKPLASARLVLIARGKDGTSETDLPARELTVGQDRFSAEGAFTLRPELLAYRIEVTDDFGFGNAVPPRRGIALAPDELPHVSLLPERFAAKGESATEETEVEGMPVPVGGAIRIAYHAQSPLGLSRARLAYRINEGGWSYLPLKEAAADAKTGPFDPRTGAFRNSGPSDQVEFCALPSPDPQAQPARTEGGGRFDFQTRALKKASAGTGTDTELEAGDRVEFCVEVFDRNPAPNRAPGRSDARIKAVVTEAQFVEWVVQTLQSESRIRQLEEKQKGVFGKSPDQ